MPRTSFQHFDCDKFSSLGSCLSFVGQVVDNAYRRGQRCQTEHGGSSFRLRTLIVGLLGGEYACREDEIFCARDTDQAR